MNFTNEQILQFMLFIGIVYLFIMWYNRSGQGAEGFWSGSPANFFPRMNTLPNCLSQQDIEWLESGVPVARHGDVSQQAAYFY